MDLGELSVIILRNLDLLKPISDDVPFTMNTDIFDPLEVYIETKIRNPSSEHIDKVKRLLRGTHVEYMPGIEDDPNSVNIRPYWNIKIEIERVRPENLKRFDIIERNVLSGPEYIDFEYNPRRN